MSHRVSPNPFVPVGTGKYEHVLLCKKRESCEMLYRRSLSSKRSSRRLLVVRHGCACCHWYQVQEVFRCSVPTSKSLCQRCNTAEPQTKQTPHTKNLFLHDPSQLNVRDQNLRDRNNTHKKCAASLFFIRQNMREDIEGMNKQLRYT